jgi:hypothetical protein
MFGPMIVGAAVAGAAGVMSLVNHYRGQLGPMSAREARLLASMPITPIAQARGGLIKIAGRVVGSVTERSYYHRVPCVALQLDHYEVRDSVNGPQRMLLRSEKKLHPFFVEDETGRVAVDPSNARIDYVRDGTDLESTIEESRLVNGDKVFILAEVRRSGPRVVHPMRHAQNNIESGIELVGSPLVTWRTEPEVYPKLSPPTGGVLLSAMSAACAALGAVLDL